MTLSGEFWSKELNVDPVNVDPKNEFDPGIGVKAEENNEFDDEPKADPEGDPKADPDEGEPKAEPVDEPKEDPEVLGDPNADPEVLGNPNADPEPDCDPKDNPESGAGPKERDPEFEELEELLSIESTDWAQDGSCWSILGWSIGFDNVIMLIWSINKQINLKFFLCFIVS